MTARKQDLIIDQGDTYQRSICWKDVDGNNVDIENYRAKMQIRPLPQSSKVIATISTEGEDNQKITVDTATSCFVISISDEVTAEYNAGAYSYDFEVISPAGDTTKLISGTVTINPEITK